MTTIRLYYDDPYTLTFNADVVEQTTYKDRPAVILDRTYFYPEGGGQLPDQGKLNGVKVVDVQTRDADRAVLHVLDQPLPDTRVEGQIEAERRADLRLHHSGQHVLSQALIQAAKAETVSVHMSLDSMTIDVKRTNIPLDDWLAVEALANRIVQQDLAVRTWFPESDELAKLPLRKMPDVVGKVRIVDMGGFDITACGGTHVARTGEIGLIKVIRYERRGDTTRLEFKCGTRSLRDYQDKNEVINRLSAELTVGYWQLQETVTRLQNEAKSLRAELKTAKEQLISAEAIEMAAKVLPQNGIKVIVQSYADRDTNDAKLLLQKLTTQPDVIALIGIAGEKSQLMFGRSENLSVDMSSLLKKALTALNSERGGGRPNYAQGGGVPATLAQIDAALVLAQAGI